MTPSRSVSVLAVAISMVACAPLPYNKADGPGVATISITNASSKWIRAMESQQGDCKDMHFWGGNVESIYPGESRTTHALPKRVWVFNVIGNVSVGSGMASSCAFTVGMDIEHGGTYEVHYIGAANGCSLESRLRDGAGWKKVELRKYDLHNRIGPQSCSPASTP